MRPVIALAMGDPAGVSPELTAKLLTLDEVVDKAANGCSAPQAALHD